MLAAPVLGQPWTKLVPQERELGELKRAPSVRVLAVDDARLIWMQLQTDLRQSRSDRVPHLPGLTFAAAVHHRVIAVPFEAQTRELPDHPRVERIMHEHVSQ